MRAFDDSKSSFTLGNPSRRTPDFIRKTQTSNESSLFQRQIMQQHHADKRDQGTGGGLNLER